MAEEQKETSKAVAPEASGPEAAGNAAVEPSPSQADTKVVAEPATEEKTSTQETSAYQPRYLGKKYSDISELEKAHENALRLANQQGEEKNALTQKVEMLESAMKQYGLTPEQSQPQSEKSVEAVVEERVAPLRRQMALREEQDAVQEVIRVNPELAPVANRIVQAWRLSGNEPLAAIVKDFKQLVQAGQRINQEDAATKKNQSIETGRGAGEANVSKQSEARQAAFRSHSLEDLAGTLPDDLGITG